MTFYVIDSSNSIHNTTDFADALSLGAGDDAVIMADGSVIASGLSATGIFLGSSAGDATLIVNGFVFGTFDGIQSVGEFATITVNGQVAADSTGVRISNSASLYISPSGLITGGFEALAVSAGYVINDGTLNSPGNHAIQITSGRVTNNGLISSQSDAFFYTGDGTTYITNTGTIQGNISTYFNASAETAELNIDNSGDWFGRLSLTPGADSVINTGTITEDIALDDGNNTLDSRYGFIGGVVSAGSGVDSILLGAEDNIITAGGGGDTINGGAGFDISSYSGSATGVSIDLLLGTTSRGDAQGDRLTSIEGLYGSAHRDILIGDNGDNLINGVLGRDTIFGNGGNDTIAMLGGNSATFINGGPGNDLIQLTTVDSALYGYAFGALDQVNGATGYDTLEITNAAASVVFGNLTVTNIERLIVTDGYNYNFTSANATVTGGTRMWVDGGSLTGFFSLRFDGSAETNGAFDFTGGAWRDTFTGGLGNDTFTGGEQKDVMTGGGGSDIFIYDSFNESRFAYRDKITDFDTATDTFQFEVEVTGIDSTVSGSVSIAADLSALVSGQFGANHAMLVNVTGGTLAGVTLLIVDADGVAGFHTGSDYAIEVTGMVGTLSLGDFIVG